MDSRANPFRRAAIISAPSIVPFHVHKIFPHQWGQLQIWHLTVCKTVSAFFAASSSCFSCSFSFSYGDTLYFLIFCQHCFYFFYNLFLRVRKGYNYHFPKLPLSLFGKITKICRMPCISAVSKYPFLIVTDSFCKTFQSIFQPAPGACNIHSDKGISVFPILPSF